MGWGKPTKTWNGQGVLVKKGRLADLRAELPEFSLEPFGQHPNINEDLQQVVRKPTLSDERTIPVGVVSLNYNLIQHTQVLDWLVDGLVRAGLADELCEADLYLSHYGERMLLWGHLKNQIFDPGDGYPLYTLIACQNSVDTTSVLEVFVMRVRTVCSNGQILGNAETIRRRHVAQRRGRLSFSQELAYVLNGAQDDLHILSRWLHTPVSDPAISQWVDTVIKKKWHTTDAARVAAICRTGREGKVELIKGQLPSHLPVGWEIEVPGACAPVANAYHAAQALSWIASQEPVLETRLERTRQIPDMVDQLIGIQ